MPIPVLPLIAACLFAAVLGFAAHRANVCIVRAAAEILSARSGFMLASIGKSMVWVILLTLPFVVATPMTGYAGWQLTAWALAGGFAFGFGAAINGGCSYSTMTRLVDGEGGKAVTVAGFGLGVVIYGVLEYRSVLDAPMPAHLMLDAVVNYATLVLLGLAAWALYELMRLWRTRERARSWFLLLSAPEYRLSVSALLIGISSTAIFQLVGSPGYTVTLQSSITAAIDLGDAPARDRWILLFAVLAGMAISTWQRGSFRLDWRPKLSWLRNLSGGILMGMGSALVPGGNDALILYGVPTFSPHALPAFVTMFAGAAIGLTVLARFGVTCSVVCRNDIYILKNQPPGSILNAHVPSKS